MTQELWHLSPKNLGPPNFCVKKIKMKAFQLLLPPLKFALRLLQFGMCIVNDICDTLAADIFFTFPPAGPQTKGLVKSLDFPTQFRDPYSPRGRRRRVTWQKRHTMTGKRYQKISTRGRGEKTLKNGGTVTHWQ